LGGGERRTLIHRVPGEYLNAATRLVPHSSVVFHDFSHTTTSF
jgi:hypothetical protein